MSMKKACPFKEKCYRKNPIHFEDMSHPHLEKLLNGQLNGAIVIPPSLDFECQDKSQLLDQLKVLQMVMRKRGSNDMSNEQYNPSESQQTIQKRLLEPSVSNSTKLMPKKQKLETHQGTSCSTSKIKLSDELQEKSIFDKFNASTTQVDRMKIRNRTIKQLQQVSHKIPHLKPIGEFDMKHALSAPYNIFLPSIENSKDTHNQAYTITFPEILDISLGEIDESLHINFMVDVGWLCLQYLFSGQRANSLIVLGERTDDAPLPDTINIVTIKTPTNYGTHHSKVSAMKYINGGIRIIISTANLYMEDWENRTQALWISPHLPQLPDNAEKTMGESRTGFKHDFIDYLKQYNKPEMQHWIKAFEKTDFSSIEVFFIASVPGNHHGVNRDRWGLQRLRRILTDNAEIPSDRSQWPVVVQASSIGSLGPTFDSWLTQDFIPAMTSEKTRGIRSSPSFQFIYPTIENYKNSFDIRTGSCCLPYSVKTHQKQKWLEKYLYQWKATKNCRDRAMPHSKIYTRISPDMKKIPWMVLTSGNLSKAAWGYGKTSWSILNYEAGIVLFPQFLINSSAFPICDSDQSCIPPIPLPYDVPLTPYRTTDLPFVMEFFQT